MRTGHFDVPLLCLHIHSEPNLFGFLWCRSDFFLRGNSESTKFRWLMWNNGRRKRALFVPSNWTSFSLLRIIFELNLDRLWAVFANWRLFHRRLNYLLIELGILGRWPKRTSQKSSVGFHSNWWLFMSSMDTCTPFSGTLHSATKHFCQKSANWLSFCLKSLASVE